MSKLTAKLTAETITDEQIRELRQTLPLVSFDHAANHEHLRAICGCALGEPGYRPEFRVDARARCAAILNARAKEGK